MRQRGLIIYAVVSALGIAFIAWQVAEHKRVVEAARQSLMSRGRAITGTLGLLIRSQRRGGGIISQERLESALAELIKPGDVESITLLNAENKIVITAGVPLEEHLSIPAGVTWTKERMLLANLVDLGTNVFPQMDGERRAIVLRDFPTPPPGTNNMFPRWRGSETRTNEDGEVVRRGPPRSRFPFGRPPWMSEEEFKTISAQQGLHSFIISIPTRSIEAAASQDFVMRLIIGLLAAATAGGAAFAWRSFERSTDLELRLVKASEMNSHLKQMNLAAAGLAHETRNPLNIIRGLAQLISKRTDTSAEVRENSIAIVEESDRLTAQLNEFINYSRPREVRKAPVELARVAAEVARALTLDAEEKQVQVALNVPPMLIEADEQLLRQTLFNLLMNAIQAVGTGEKVSIEVQRESNGEVVLEVRDTGPGVPPEHRGEIFKPYFTTNEHGSGLGLAIVRQIVLAHGWSIEYAPNEPTGAIFRIVHIRAKG
jgi:signal transduction histidine kinase